MEEIKENTPRGNEDNESEKENNVNNNDDNYTNTNKEEITPNNEDIKEEIQFSESDCTMPIETVFNDEKNNFQINLENEFNEIIETNPVEEIDNYIDNLKNRFSKAKMMRLNTTQKNPQNENSDPTVDKNLTNNANNIILEDICKIFY